MSKSPVYVKRREIWMIVGIHFGFDALYNSHYAAAITLSKFQWIHKSTH